MNDTTSERNHQRSTTCPSIIHQQSQTEKKSDRADHCFTRRRKRCWNPARIYELKNRKNEHAIFWTKNQICNSKTCKPSSLREEVPQRNRDSRNGTFAPNPYVEDNFIKQTTKAYLQNKTTVVDRAKNNIFGKLWKCRRLQDVHIIYEQKTLLVRLKLWS